MTDRRGGLRSRLGAVGLMAFVAAACRDGPDVPHPVGSTSDGYCLNCHTGRAGAPETGHDSDETDCTSCHEVTDRGPYPPLMPHRGGEQTKCALCHLEEVGEAVPTSHLDEVDCYACHEAPDSGPWPPAQPHRNPTPSEAECLACHTVLDHWDGPSCSACHQD